MQHFSALAEPVHPIAIASAREAIRDFKLFIGMPPHEPARAVHFGDFSRARRNRGTSHGSGGMSSVLRMAKTETPWRIGR
jgi:hypothetical protein